MSIVLKVKRIRERFWNFVALFAIAFLIRYVIAPSKIDKVMFWLYLLMPIITVIVLVVL